MLHGENVCWIIDTRIKFPSFHPALYKYLLKFKEKKMIQKYLENFVNWEKLFVPSHLLFLNVIFSVLSQIIYAY